MSPVSQNSAAPIMSQSKRREIFKRTLAKKKVLIVDPSGTSRSAIFRILCDLGLKPFQILLAPTLENAKNQIKEHRPEIILCEYRLGSDGKTGLDLLEYQRTQFPEIVRTSFILLTPNSSQSLVARAVEEDVDGFIIKPFSPNTLRETILKCVERTSKPPIYLEKIQAGKKFLLQGENSNAELQFESALKLADKPALACYYLGKIKAQREDEEEAAKYYEKGLTHNKLHFKCLSSLFQIYQKSGRKEDAYRIGKTLVESFPTHSDRLIEVIKLGIETQNYRDIETLESVFLKLDDRTDELVQAFCAALTVAAKHYLRADESEKALLLFKRAAILGHNRPKILKEIIQTLIDYKLAPQADEFLRRMPAEVKKTDLYRMLDFQIANLVYGASQVLARGREILSEGNGNERFYEIMIARALEAGLNYAAEIYVQEAQMKFPYLATKFETMLRSIRTTRSGDPMILR